MSLKQKVTYAQFKQAKVKWESLGGNILDVKKERTKYKPKVYIEPPWLTEYIVQRDRVIWKLFVNSRKEIEEKYAK